MTKIAICGCGNAAQLMTALVAMGGHADVCIYAPFMDEAARFKKAIEESPDGLEVTGPTDDMSFKVKLSTSQVSKVAKEAISDADLILLPLPAFAVGPTLKDIGQYVKNGAKIGILPGQGGSQWAAVQSLGSNFNQDRNIVLFAMEKLPYNVRITEYGKKIHVFSYKRVGVGSIPVESAPECVKLVSECVPYMDATPVPHILSTTLTTGNQCIHPARMYGLAHSEKFFDRNQLFYEEMDQQSADRIQGVSDEIAAVAKAIEKIASVDLSNVVDIKQAMLDAYGPEVEDKSSLLNVLKTNKGFKGIYSPMLDNGDGKWVVDWKSRYILDDVPYGLCVLRGIAELVDVKTPTVDLLINWAQEHMGKCYLENDKLCGKDVIRTGSPQAFGFKCLSDLPEIGK